MQVGVASALDEAPMCEDGGDGFYEQYVAYMVFLFLNENHQVKGQCDVSPTTRRLLEKGHLIKQTATIC